MKIKDSQIKDDINVCPHCLSLWTPIKDRGVGCCGEQDSQPAWLLNDDSIILKIDAIIKEDLCQ